MFLFAYQNVIEILLQAEISLPKSSIPVIVSFVLS